MMEPPKPFNYDHKRGFSECMACGRWTKSNNYFHMDGINWILCVDDFADYWENTDELLPDYKGY